MSHGLLYVISGILDGGLLVFQIAVASLTQWFGDVMFVFLWLLIFCHTNTRDDTMISLSITCFNDWIAGDFPFCVFGCDFVVFVFFVLFRVDFFGFLSLWFRCGIVTAVDYVEVPYHFF